MTATTALVLLLPSFLSLGAHGFSVAPTSKPQEVGNVLILDHLNINHQKGRHDWLKAYYFDFLKCAVDPRKDANIEAGDGTLWANIGANQFHLPQGKPDAQVLEGVITLGFPNLKALESRLQDAEKAMEGSQFAVLEQTQDCLTVRDPWGSIFRLVQGVEKDPRGTQAGDLSEGLNLRDLTFHVPNDSNLEGIARFYKQILDCPVLELSKSICRVSVGPMQTLTFCFPHENKLTIRHDDLRDDGVASPAGMPTFLSNYGPHVSMYVADLTATYQRADQLGLTYVNPRFKRRAYNLKEVLDDCMFRCLDIVDPENVEAGPILKLEHEVRGVVKPDGTKYKSCPFDEIPDAVVAPV